MVLRIQGGCYKGRGVRTVLKDTRPTMGWARGVVFNWIYNSIRHKKILDACCGSGVMALESLSLGAQSATCIDIDQSVVVALQQQAQAWGVTLDALQHTWPHPWQPATAYDIIFWDPPYAASWRHDIFKLCTDNTWLAPQGILIIESAAGDVYQHPQWREVKKRSRGQTQLQLLIYDI